MPRHFDIFVLSDTRKDDIAAAERDAFDWLQRQLSPAIKVYYRRRDNNHHRKAGNIADFVTRWGGAYDHMIVLDADSDMIGRRHDHAGPRHGGGPARPASSSRCRCCRTAGRPSRA